MVDGFDFFLEKGKEKEDDLHKSYNDRSYLSSEEVGPQESRTGEWQRLEAPERTTVALLLERSQLLFVRPPYTAVNNYKKKKKKKNVPNTNSARSGENIHQLHVVKSTMKRNAYHETC